MFNQTTVIHQCSYRTWKANLCATCKLLIVTWIRKRTWSTKLLLLTKHVFRITDLSQHMRLFVIVPDDTVFGNCVNWNMWLRKTHTVLKGDSLICCYFYSVKYWSRWMCLWPALKSLIYDMIWYFDVFKSWYTISGWFNSVCVVSSSMCTCRLPSYIILQV